MGTNGNDIWLVMPLTWGIETGLRIRFASQSEAHVVGLARANRLSFRDLPVVDVTSPYMIPIYMSGVAIYFVSFVCYCCLDLHID